MARPLLRRVFTDTELKRLQAAVADPTISLTDTTRRFRVGIKGLKVLIEQHGWKVGSSWYKRGSHG